jgi:hypothetical protein
MVRRTNLLPGEADVFDLNVGDVTQVLNSQDAFIILKLESKHPVPIETAQSEIKTILQQERMTQELQTAAKNVNAQFNLAYQGMPSAPELFLPPATAQPSLPKGITSDLRSRAPRRRVPVSAQRPRVLPAPR